MNNSTLFLAMHANYRQMLVNSCRNFHSVQVLRQLQQQYMYPDNPHVDSSLFFTNLPNKRREKRLRKEIPINKLRSGTLVIECKNKELNHYSGMQYGKLDVIPLASKSWAHRKARGDYFTILPTQKYSPFLKNEDLPETFEAFGVRKELIEQLGKINVTKPTAIQAKVLGKLLAGENALMFAECGSGKTLGYCVAMIENILKWKDKVPPTVNSPLGIIVTASRELAVQVLTLASSLGSDLGLYCHGLLDGHSRDLLQNPEMRPVDILVCTVSAIKKHLKAEIYSTKYCKHVVIDDADYFETEEKFQPIKAFIKNTGLVFTGLDNPTNRENTAQICFVSAVAPSTLEGKLNDLVEMNGIPVISTPYLHQALCNVRQKFIRVSGYNLAEELLKLAKSNAKRKIPTIMFSNSNKTCNWSAFFLKENGVDCVTMNKNDRPSQRLENYRNFEMGLVNVLCSTNMLSVGFHFPMVKHVVSVEFPKFMSDYIHRCGRVGRLGQAEDCLITNFIKSKPNEIQLVQKIEKAVRTNKVLPSVYCPKTY